MASLIEQSVRLLLGYIRFASPPPPLDENTRVKRKEEEEKTQT